MFNQVGRKGNYEEICPEQKPTFSLIKASRYQFTRSTPLPFCNYETTNGDVGL